MKTQYTLSEVETAMQKEGIGRSSTRYVIETLQKIEKKESQPELRIPLTSGIKYEVKQKPTQSGVKVYPYSNNHVTFEHNGERCLLHFLENGNFGLSREGNKDCYLEINKNQIMELLLSKF